VATPLPPPLIVAASRLQFGGCGRRLQLIRAGHRTPPNQLGFTDLHSNIHLSQPNRAMPSQHCSGDSGTGGLLWYCSSTGHSHVVLHKYLSVLNSSVQLYYQIYTAELFDFVSAEALSPYVVTYAFKMI